MIPTQPLVIPPATKGSVFAMSQPKIPKKGTYAKQELVELPVVFRCFSSNLDLDRILHVINMNNRKTKRLWTAGRKIL